MVKEDLNLRAKPHFTLISVSSAMLPLMYYNYFFFPVFALSRSLNVAALKAQLRRHNDTFHFETPSSVYDHCVEFQ